MPDQLRHKITVQLTDADNPGMPAFTYIASLPQLAGKRFTVSYDPATAADQTTINNYVDQYATSIPAYLVQFKPVLKIEGTVVAIGTTVGMGNAQNLTISIASPNGTEMVTHNLLAGDYTAIGLNPSKISPDFLQKRTDKNDYSEPVGEMLHQTAISYWAEADAFNSVIAKTMRVNNLRHPSELAAAAKVSVSYVWGVPTSAIYESRALDVKLDNQSVATRSKDKTKEFYYMQQSGMTSSFLEGATYDQLFGGNIGDGISAITALKMANEQGIPIYKIDSSNIATDLSKLQVSAEVKTEISNAVNAGMLVQIPQSNITKSDWTGVGYIVLNKTDGSGAYRISGGLNGDISKTPAKTVYPIAQVPATGVGAMILGSIANSNQIVLKVVGGVIVGIEIPAWLVIGTIAVFILALIAVMAEAISKTKPAEDWVTLRHYTKDWLVPIICLMMGLESESGQIFLTELRLSPGGSRPDGTPNNVYIANALELMDKNGNRDTSKGTGYLELQINRAAFGGQPQILKPCAIQDVQPCNEWVYPLPFLEINTNRVRLIDTYPK